MPKLLIHLAIAMPLAAAGGGAAALLMPVTLAARLTMLAVVVLATNSTTLLFSQGRVRSVKTVLAEGRRLVRRSLRLETRQGEKLETRSTAPLH